VKQFVTPFTGAGSDFTRGFAIQGVNSDEASTTGNILAVSLSDFAINRYDMLNAGTAGATLTASVTIGDPYTFNDPARQPSVAIAANRRIVDSLDDRVGSAVYEANGRIYAVHTVTPIGGDETRVRWYVIDSASNTVLDSGEIGEAGYDYYQGSIAVNAAGQVVIGYNRSGLNPADGNISLLAQMFETKADGSLVEVGDALLLKVGLTDDYHNGSIFGQPAAGRQRWQDFSSVSLDPTDSSIFWVQGGFPREYNLPEFGHPGGTGGSRWGTWIAAIQFPGSMAVIPEPATWALMIAGFGAVGVAARRRRRREALA
jgi:hypothetical protein